MAEHVYEIVSNRSFLIKDDSDSRECDIRGVCLLGSGQLVIVDYNNRKVKLLNAEMQLTSTSTFKNHPHDVCMIANDTIAVTVAEWDNPGEIHLFKVTGDSFQALKVLPLDHYCNGISSINGQLIVRSNTALLLYSTEGELIKQLFVEENATEYGHTTEYSIDSSSDGQYIYMADFPNDQILTLDKDGNLLATYQDEKALEYIAGVCSAECGAVFVSETGAHSIMQIKKDGTQRLASLAKNNHGVYIPRALHFDNKTKRLFVGQLDDDILVLHLK